jgi:hypothetical protein
VYVYIYIYIPYYFEFKVHLLSHFSELNIRARLKFRYLKASKKLFPLRTDGVTNRAVNNTGSEMHLLTHFFSKIPFKSGASLKFEELLYVDGARGGAVG